MLRARVVPSLLLRNGGLVKTRQFDSYKYIGDPLNAIRIFNEKKVDELFIVDIDASARQHEPDMTSLRLLATEARMPLTYGGGIASAKVAAEIIGLGYEKVSISSAAISNRRLLSEISEEIGQQSVVFSLDVRKQLEASQYVVFTHNGTTRVSEPLDEIIESGVASGAGEIVATSIDCDGEMRGYDLELARLVRSVSSTPISIAGGAGTIHHIQELLDTVGVVGAIAGSLFVFKGPMRAVLLSYGRPERLN
jgi:cyclase